MPDEETKEVEPKKDEEPQVDSGDAKDESSKEDATTESAEKKKEEPEPEKDMAKEPDEEEEKKKPYDKEEEMADLSAYSDFVKSFIKAGKGGFKQASEAWNKRKNLEELDENVLDSIVKKMKEKKEEDDEEKEKKEMKETVQKMQEKINKLEAESDEPQRMTVSAELSQNTNSNNDERMLNYIQKLVGGVE